MGGGAQWEQGVTNSIHGAAGASVIRPGSAHTPNMHKYFSCCEVQTDVNMLLGEAGSLSPLGFADTEILPQVTWPTHVWVDTHTDLGGGSQEERGLRGHLRGTQEGQAKSMWLFCGED